jgi:membrane-bound ClpP family serine protease
MFTKDEIFTRLMNGESMDSIMAEMDSVAKAAAVEAEKAKQAAKELEEKKKAEAVKVELADAVAEGLNRLMALVCPDVIKVFGEDKDLITGRMLIETLESSGKSIRAIVPVMEELEKACSCGDKFGCDPIQTFIDNGFKF